jgi:hypothetical protein
MVLCAPFQKHPLQRLGKHGQAMLMLLVVLITASLIHVPAVYSQPVPHRTLQIQDNTVYIDGNAVSEETLPSGLVLDGVQMQYQVYGLQVPIVEIQGQPYRLTESTLEPVERASDAAQEARETPDATGAKTLQAAPASSDYMQMLRAQSQRLYEAVQREYALEHAAEQRAYRIRQLDAGPERTAHLDTLRQTITQLFDLKQANRRRELQQLQQQVEAMRQRMQERAAHREAMIEQRIQQLTDHANYTP